MVRTEARLIWRTGASTYLTGRGYRHSLEHGRSDMERCIAEVEQAALRQFGPWSHDEDIKVDAAWLDAAMIDKIRSINCEEPQDDVRRFLRPAEEQSLILWSEKFFTSKLAKLVAHAPEA